MDNNKEQNQIYREKYLEQLSSPDQLTGYLRVAGSGVWFILAGIILLIAGLIVWGIFGQIYTTVTVPAVVKGSQVSCYILTDDLTQTDDAVRVSIGDQDMTAETGDMQAQTMDASADPALYASGYLSPGRNVYILTCATALEDGYYDARITTETLHPISLLFAKS